MDQFAEDTAGAVASYLNPDQGQPAIAARASMQVAADSNPDLEAELRRASARTGVPLSAAREFPQEVKRQAEIEEHDYDELARQYPGTTRFLADPDNSRIVRDDVGNLTSSEATIGVIQGPRPTVGSYITGVFTNFTRGADMARQGMRMGFADLYDQVGLFSKESNAAMRDDALRKRSLAGLQIDSTSPEFETSTARGVYGGVSSAARMAPALVAAVTTRSSAPLLGIAGAQTSTEAYGKYRERGGTAGEALAGGVAEGGIEVVTEMLPMGFLVSNMGRVGAGKFLTGLLAREIPSEQLATLTQDAVDTAIANPDKTWAQYVAERPDAAYQTLLATITQSALMGGTNEIMLRAQGRHQQAEHAANVGDALAQLNELAAASKVRERDASTSQAFLQSLMQEGRSTVWITPQALADSGMLEQMAESIPSVAAQLEQAAMTGAEISIPIAELMANMAGPEIANTIIPHLADQPGGFTQTTANEYMQSGAAQELADEVRRTLGAKQEDDAFNASRDVVTGGVLEQLNAAGRFSPDVNQAYASMVGNFFAVQAAKLGITPEEMAQRYPLQVRAERLAGAKTLDQSAPKDEHVGKKFDSSSAASDYLDKNKIRATHRLDEVGRDKYEIRSKAPKGDWRAATAEREARLKAALGDTYEQSGHTIEVDGVRRPIKNSKGQPIAGTFAEQVAFWKWFGDSKVVDDHGRPLVVYHGTLSGGFSSFEKGPTGTYGDGIYFASDPATASFWAGDRASEGMESEDGGSVYPSYVQISNPASEAHAGAMESIHGSNTSSVLAEQGFDGVITEDGEIVAFQPTQVKSATGNDGTFDANDPNILSQDQRSPRGSISLGNDITQTPSVITLLAKADLSTFLHESGHFFLEVMNDMASQPDAPAEIKADMDAVLEWFGVPDLAAWDSYDIEQKRDYHEQFARGFEAYLFEGKSPNAEMAGLFARFRSWLVNVYRSLSALNVELTPELRAVFDRMLASADAIAQAEREEGFAGLFGTRPDFMTEEEWTEYRGLNMQASEDAVRNLETRSLRDMQWLENARANILKEMQRENAAKRKAIRDEVAAEVMAEPVNVARTFFGRGLNPDGSAAGMHKLSIDSLIEMYGGEGDKFARLDWEPLGYGKYGALAKDGLSPDVAADLLGFASGDDLVRAMLDTPPAKQVIQERTDQRMLERYGDLNDEQAIEQAISEALHERAHTRFLATELNALRRASGSPAILAKAAQTYAERIVRRTVIRELRPDLFTAAARRAARAAAKAFQAGDIQEAAAQKQIQLINSFAAKAAMDARADVQKTMTRFARIANGKNETASKTRDMDMVQATRAILAEFGVGARSAKATEYLAAVDAYDPGLAKILRDRIDAATEHAKPIKELTIDELGALKDDIESLWFLAQRSRQMEVDGDLLDRQDIQEQLRVRMDEIGVPQTVAGEQHAITPDEVRLTRIQTLKASLRRVEAWADLKDGESKMGPFRKFIWNPIKDAADAYRVDKAKYLKSFRALLDPIAPTLKQVKIAAPELGYSFGYDNGGMGKMELLHAILHTGNAGNKKKLLLGRRWATQMEDGTLDTSRWDAFINRMITEGVLTKAEFDFAQGVWDLMEEMKPAAQKTHRQVFGRYFDEVTADAFTTPWGEYKGGYVPAVADSRIVADAKTRAIMEEEMASMMNVLPSTSKGFTKARVEYNRPLLLDLRLLAQHIDKVLLFTHMEQPITDVRRLLGSNAVATPLHKIDSTAYDGLLTPWLNRAARQQVETPVAGDNGTMGFFRGLRQRAGMAAMFANVSNTAQQITGFSIAMLKVKPRYLGNSMIEYMRAPRQLAASVAAASPYMANRMENEVSAMTGAINDILLNPGLYEKSQAWASKHAYFLQLAVDNVMGPIIWTGAYTQAMETAPAGLSEPEIVLYARRLADSAVRETQGSTLPEDIARFETGNAFYRIFTQFAGYFNMQANILGTEFAKTIRQDTGLDKKAGRGLYTLMFGFMVPAWVATAIALAFRGGPDDEDKDGEYWDDWMAQTFGWGTLRSATALIPVFGQIANSAANRFTGKQYDDRISTGPAISMLEGSAGILKDAYDLTQGTVKPKTAVRDVATLLSLISGLPVAGAARPLMYAVDVAGGATPSGPVDAARGVISGTASPASKGR